MMAPAYLILKIIYRVKIVLHTLAILYGKVKHPFWLRKEIYETFDCFIHRKPNLE